MNRIGKIMNTLTDMEMMWFPFLFLRPQKNVRMTTLVVLKIALYYGTIGGLILGLILFRRTQEYMSFVYAIIGFIPVFFLGFRFTFAYFWNKRVQALVG